MMDYTLEKEMKKWQSRGETWISLWIQTTQGIQNIEPTQWSNAQRTATAGHRLLLFQLNCIPKERTPSNDQTIPYLMN